MLQNVKIEDVNKNTLDIGKDIVYNYILDSIDFGDVEVEFTDYNIPKQTGKTYTGKTIGIRDISIVGYIVDMETNGMGMTWKQYFELQKAEIERKKKELNVFLCVGQEYKIYCGDYYLEKCICSENVKYSIDEEENNEVLCRFEIGFRAYNPMFKKEDETEQFHEINKMSYMGQRSKNLFFPYECGVFEGENATVVLPKTKDDVRNNFVISDYIEVVSTDKLYVWMNYPKVVGYYDFEFDYMLRIYDENKQYIGKQDLNLSEVLDLTENVYYPMLLPLTVLSKYSNCKYIRISTLYDTGFRIYKENAREAFILGAEKRSRVKVIQNNSDEDVGAIIEVELKGMESMYFKFTNITDNEYLEIYIPVYIGTGKLIINTHTGQEGAYIQKEGSSTLINYTGNITKNSKFINVKRGTKIYSYELSQSKGGTFVDADVSIKFAEQMLSIEQM